MVDHHCHANACQEPTEPPLLMCRKHWRMVPTHFKAAVWNAYRNAPSPGRSRNRAYLTACAAAVEYVARVEGVDEGNSYRRILNMPNGCTS